MKIYRPGEIVLLLFPFYRCDRGETASSIGHPGYG